MDGAGVGGRWTAGHGDERRADDAVSQAVAAPDLLDDLALAAIRARDVDDGLVLARVERRARVGHDGAHALALEQLPELPVDGRDALGPRVLGELRGARVDRPVEVVRDGQDLRDEALVGEPRAGQPLLGAAALEVQELRAFALERGEVLVGLGARVVPLGPEGLEIGGEGGGGRIELVDALLGAGLVMGQGALSKAGRGPVPGRTGSSSGQAYRWSMSSSISPDTKRTVPMAWG